VEEHRDDLMESRSSGLGAIPPRTLIAVAVIVAALLRIAWAVRHGLAIDQDGAEYARIAQNLLAGRGYVGIFDRGPQLNYAPLYPLMIAGVSLVLRSTELAARAINIAFGAALVIPMFKIAERLYGRRVAGTVTALVVFHPALIALAASTYAEGPYLTLLMSGLLFLMKWVADRRIGAGIAAGGLFGIAYLVRPEAFVFAGGFVTAGLAAALFTRERRATLFGALALAATFAVVASPYVAFLTLTTGRFRIEGKGAIAYQWGRRINGGMTNQEAGWGIGEDLSDQGTFMRSQLGVVNSTSYTVRDLQVYLLKNARREVGVIHHTIVDEEALGSPILFALAVIGLFGAAWDRRQAALNGVLLAMVGMVALTLFTAPVPYFRLFYPLVGPLLIWAGKGADDLRIWGGATVASLSHNERVVHTGGAVLKWAAIGLLLMVSLRALPNLGQFKDSLAWERARVGRWLAPQLRGHTWVMDTGVQVAYYAGADMIYLPRATSDLALRYIAARQPSFIVLHSGTTEGALAYAPRWFDSGIPDKRAILVYDQGAPPQERIKIYRWVGDSMAAP
jgi:4-amino-4-deoxy-L-arabinose transferase-like glycosyltransferase